MPQSDNETPAAALGVLVDVLGRLSSAPSVPGAEAASSPSAVSSADEVLAALVRLRELRELLAAWEPRLIEAARAAGISWTQLAPALGVASRQAAERRYLRLNPHATKPGLTGEQRVQAARDERAGDRAVAVWARNNAADLRRLAGQVAALDGLDSRTQESVDAVHEALGANDSAALLEPLAEAAQHLSKVHPGLAGRISDLGSRTDEIRQSTQNRNRR
ncbi:hypothetical protein EV646_117118 [Kribbella antiqua]|uniref:HSP18 transcriptional regulator n=1 Tax=Kribbella antiqua TaxID=2512217 RepID=A0A4R2I8V7_9ACTN|nr:hypothetical protein [Kribbella antiqua]TCO40577.1 hypothetical protein EV646_117118 [Kribbella antiqua]